MNQCAWSREDIDSGLLYDQCFIKIGESIDYYTFSREVELREDGVEVYTYKIEGFLRNNTADLLEGIDTSIEIGNLLWENKIYTLVFNQDTWCFECEIEELTFAERAKNIVLWVFSREKITPTKKILRIVPN